MAHRPYFEEHYLNRIGIWEDRDEIVTTTLFDTTMDAIFCVTLPEYTYLNELMIDYARKNMVAIVEPVCTIPEYRRLGLAKIFEGFNKVKNLGEKIAVVGSSQQFYYSIGMRPYKIGKFRK